MTADEAKAFEHANIILQALGVQERVEVVLSQVQLRKGDVALLCSDGLHGPVTDEEILAVLIGEQDLQKAGESLIGKALDRDGPDNITVVLARFDGEGLTAPMPEDLVSFVGYDPGGDPIPEPVPVTAGSEGSFGAQTVEERLPRDLLTADDVPTRADPDELPGSKKTVAPYGGSWARSLLTVFLLALVFAAAGGIFVTKCERSESARGDTRVTLP